MRPQDSDPPTSVYKYYDKNDVLIYVGITSRGIGRNREHNRTKDWWPLVTRQEVEHLPSRIAALRREKALIALHAPPFNVHHNPDHDLLRAAYLQYADPGDSREAALALYTELDHHLPLVFHPTADHIAFRSHPAHFTLARRVRLRDGEPVKIHGKDKGVIAEITLHPPYVVFHTGRRKYDRVVRYAVAYLRIADLKGDMQIHLRGAEVFWMPLEQRAG